MNFLIFNGILETTYSSRGTSMALKTTKKAPIKVRDDGNVCSATDSMMNAKTISCESKIETIVGDTNWQAIMHIHNVATLGTTAKYKQIQIEIIETKILEGQEN